MHGSRTWAFTLRFLGVAMMGFASVAFAQQASPSAPVRPNQQLRAAHKAAPTERQLSVVAKPWAGDFDAMLELPEIGELDGVVLGRVDMTGSLGLSREDINRPEILDISRRVFQAADGRTISSGTPGQRVQ